MLRIKRFQGGWDSRGVVIEGFQGFRIEGAHFLYPHSAQNSVLCL